MGIVGKINNKNELINAFSFSQFWTRAAVPYGEIPSTDVRHFLESGRRLSQPIHCPDVLFELMISCWRSRPIDRPDFSQIGQRMREMLQVEKKTKFYLISTFRREKKGNIAELGDAVVDSIITVMWDKDLPEAAINHFLLPYHPFLFSPIISQMSLLLAVVGPKIEWNAFLY